MSKKALHRTAIIFIVFLLFIGVFALSNYSSERKDIFPKAKAINEQLFPDAGKTCYSRKDCKSDICFAEQDILKNCVVLNESERRMLAKEDDSKLDSHGSYYKCEELKGICPDYSMFNSDTKYARIWAENILMIQKAYSK